MENAQLIGLSRQMSLSRQMDVVANNIANINTSGYKAQSLLFEEYVGDVASHEEARYPDRPLSFTHDWTTVQDFGAGAIRQTGNPLDVALDGDGFLAVTTPAGDRWTRTGELKLDNTGRLVTNSGYVVQGDNGAEIRFGPEETGITFNADGSISSSAGNKGALRIVSFDEPQALVREGSNLFSGGDPVEATETRVRQGAIEGSNVSGVREISEMIRVQRAYQSIASLLQKQDELRSSAISTLGRLS